MLVLTFDFYCVAGTEMEHMFWIFLIFCQIFSVGAQFNGYNCDSNFHSRFPGEKLEGKKEMFIFAFIEMTKLLKGNHCSVYFLKKLFLYYMF